jgi:hypothetical protein
MERIHIDPQKHLVVIRPVDQRITWDYVPYDGTQYRIAPKPDISVQTELLGNQQISGLKCWANARHTLIHRGLFREISSRLPALRKFGMQEILELMFGSWLTIPTRRLVTCKQSCSAPRMVTLTHPFLPRLLDRLFKQGIGKSRLREARLIGSYTAGCQERSASLLNRTRSDELLRNLCLCASQQLQSQTKCLALKSFAVNNSCARPKFVPERFDNHNGTGLPRPLCLDSHSV